MNCPNCNKPLQPNQRFCPGCGTKVEQLTTGAQQTEWQPQEVQPEQPQAEWQPPYTQPEQPQTQWQPQNAQPQPPVQPPQPAYQPPQSGQNDRYAAQFQQYQQPSRFANPKHAQNSAVMPPKAKKKKDKK